MSKTTVKRDPVYTLVAAMQSADGHRQVLKAKGFTRPGAELMFKRVDADLYWDNVARVWVCDIFVTQDGKRIKPFTRKSNEMLNALLKSFF